MISLLQSESERQSGFSVAQAIWDTLSNRTRPDLTPAFIADMVHLIRGLDGHSKFTFIESSIFDPTLNGRAAALARSDSLDRIARYIEEKMQRFPSNLTSSRKSDRLERRTDILRTLNGTPDNWNDWHWQTANVIQNPDKLSSLILLTASEREILSRARRHRLPFGITPYYLSLMDSQPSENDRALRAQVIPPPDYVDHMSTLRGREREKSDFMRETDTSPVDLVTRRYPGIAILKPFNTCPQICVYCQRNWEIEDAMTPDALASPAKITEAVKWLSQHRGIHEVLITGGDPLVMEDETIKSILNQLAEIPWIDLIRIGTRTPVTLPMRITPEFASLLGKFRIPGRREIALVTHVEHPSEITQDIVDAVNNLRMQGIAVYNQLVYTFFVSRRFEGAALRKLLRRVGIDPYYTFIPKGKEETAAYRVPIARVLQEQKEEMRLLPGLRRTDEPVYNVPGMGKNYLRARQHRDWIGLLPDGARTYAFHPWEKNIIQCESYITTDIPILDYLCRMIAIGEQPADYESIWYYF